MVFASVLALVLVFSPAAPDTTVNLGVVQRDLTGDGVPETLSLTGRGQTIDSLEITFAITSAGRPLYETRWRVTRVVGYDADRRVLSPAEHRARLKELSAFFFAADKFMSPDEFVSKWRAQAPGRVNQMPEAGITVFQFSTGGDGVAVIGWSTTEQRFVRLLECC